MSTTAQTATAQSARAPMRRKPLLTRLARRIDERLNPFFVKDVRSWLRSRLFMVIFFIALASCLVVTLLLIVKEESGRDLFSALAAGLAMVLVGVVPYLMQDRFADELAGGATELTLISRMTPGRMVRGKVMSGLLANLLFFSAVGPSVLIAYMLGGIHPIAMVYVLFAILGFSTFSMIIAIVFVTIVGRRLVRFISLALFVAGFGVAALMVGLAQITSRRPLFLDIEFWLTNGALIAEALMGGLFLYSVSVSRLSFTSADRDALPRIMLSIWSLLHLVIGFGLVFLHEQGVVPHVNVHDISEMAVVFGTTAFTLGLFFLAGTAGQLSRRLLAERSNLIRRWFLLPGVGRLYVYAMIHFAVLGAAAVFYYYTAPVRRSPVGFLGFVFCGYYLICGCYLGYRLVGRFIFKGKTLPPTMTMGIIAAIWLVWGIVLIAIFNEGAGLFLAVSPASAMFYIGYEKDEIAFWAVVTLTSPCWITATWIWLRAFARDIAVTRIAKVSAAPSDPKASNG